MDIIPVGCTGNDGGEKKTGASPVGIKTISCNQSRFGKFRFFFIFRTVRMVVHCTLQRAVWILQRFVSRTYIPFSLLLSGIASSSQGNPSHDTNFSSRERVETPGGTKKGQVEKEGELGAHLETAPHVSVVNAIGAKNIPRK